MSWLVLGGCHFDERFSVDRLDAGQSAPAARTRAVGGVAFNVARAIVSTDSKIDTAFLCGDDADGKALALELAAAGMRAPQIIKGQRTGRYTAIEDPTGKLLYGLADMDIYEALGPQYASLCKCRDVILDSNPPGAFMKALAEAGASSLHLVATSPAKLGKVKGLLPHLSSLFLNPDEAEALVGRFPARQDQAQALKVLGPDRVILTNGPGPVTCATNGSIWQSPAPQKLDQGVSHTGLGDRFAGLVLASLARKLPLEQAVTQALETL